jgi:hypothetical protein
MARRSLRDAGLPFQLIRAEDIRRGALDDYRLLFVPGGWAGQKLEALGSCGVEAVRRFVAQGGNYLGICGGAGLATQDGLGLLPVARKASRERLPSFSGPVKLSLTPHPLWEEVKSRVFQVWWPSQLVVYGSDVQVLATYEEALPEARSADIRVEDGNRDGWENWEKQYGIPLDPARLEGEPSVLAGRFGLGTVLLSLIHFDTPGDTGGQGVLQNIWKILAQEGGNQPDVQAARTTEKLTTHHLEAGRRQLLTEIRQWERLVTGLIQQGEEKSLWSWRNPWLLQWRRGVRGLEFSTLSLLVRTLAAKSNSLETHPQELWPAVTAISRDMAVFIDKSICLLNQEKDYLLRAPLSPLLCPDPAITDLRRELFGPAMSHGGRFKRLLDPLDKLLFSLL